jgi:hypothetical protein
VGSGDKVTDQTPVGGSIVPNGATVILYMGGKKPDTLCTVPNVLKMSASAANQAMTNAGAHHQGGGYHLHHIGECVCNFPERCGGEQGESGNCGDGSLRRQLGARLRPTLSAWFWTQYPIYPAKRSGYNNNEIKCPKTGGKRSPEHETE